LLHGGAFEAGIEIDVLLPLIVKLAKGAWLAPLMPLVHHLGIVSSLPDEPEHGARNWLNDHLFYGSRVEEML
jgi:hypothetical protein